MLFWQATLLQPSMLNLLVLQISELLQIGQKLPEIHQYRPVRKTGNFKASELVFFSFYCPSKLLQKHIRHLQSVKFLQVGVLILILSSNAVV